MSKSDSDNLQDEAIKAEVSSELNKAKQFAQSLNLDDVKSGQWFVNLLQQVVRSYDRNARAEYFQQKYPGLPPDEIADKLTSVTVRYATIAGAIAGAAATANQIATLSSVGMTAALFVTTIGAEMIYLSRIQMRLVLDIAVVYDLHLDPEDPEDVLMVFGYALGVAPTEILGKGIQVAAGASTKAAVRKHISKTTLKAIQDFARKLGFKILQRTIIKYAVPIASAAVGSSYNYVTTKSVGRIAKSHLKNRGKVTDGLRVLVSRQNTYDLAFPAAAMYMAQVDGHYSEKEKEFYRAMLTRMSFDGHTQAEFQKLINHEENLLEAMAQIEDEETRASLVEVMVLMAVYDGELAEVEREFLLKTATRLNVSLDIDEIEQRTEEYRIVVGKSVLQKTAGVAGGAAAKVFDVAGQATGSVKSNVTEAGSKVRGTFGKVLSRRRSSTKEESTNVETSTVTCANCSHEVNSEFQFCPNCGTAIATEKACVSCQELISVDFTFCPHCGASQE